MVAIERYDVSIAQDVIVFDEFLNPLAETGILAENRGGPAGKVAARLLA
ncbi:hypothetical protein [Luteolibacter marinus]|nr:hypothetical protein [Luteolibacter marinus]